MGTGQQSYRAKKEKEQEEKEAEHRIMEQGRLLRRLWKLALMGILVATIGYGVYVLANSDSDAPEPEWKDLSRAIPIMGENHILPDSPLPEYNSNPPTSGPHFSQTARSGFREEAIPDQYIIHNLEHGDIWISYHPRIADEMKEGLKRFAAATGIITPREA